MLYTNFVLGRLLARPPPSCGIRLRAAIVRVDLLYWDFVPSPTPIVFGSSLPTRSTQRVCFHRVSLNDLPLWLRQCDQTQGQRVFPCVSACGCSALTRHRQLERHEFRTDCSYIRGPSWLGYCAVRFRGHCAAEPFVERRAVMPLPFPQMHSPNNLTIVKKYSEARLSCTGSRRLCALRSTMFGKVVVPPSCENVLPRILQTHVCNSGCATED